MPREPRRKKTQQILLRLEPALSEEFSAALESSEFTAQDALRAGVQAMVAAQKKFGRIPKDMEIRQAHIGDLVDINELLERFQATAEARGEYLFQSKKPPPLTRRPHKNRGTGPDALVSDNPA